MSRGPARPRTTGVVLAMLVWFLAVAVSPAQESGASVSVRMSAARAAVYVDERFDVTLHVDARGVNLGRDIKLAGLPAGDLIELGEFNELAPQTRMKGRILHQTRTFRCRARALRPGPITLAPTVRLTLQVVRRMLIGRSIFEEPRTVKCPPLTVMVEPLPTEGRPEAFSGAVGQFAFDVALTPTNLPVGGLITADLRISGDGHLGDLEPPRFSPGRHFKVYDPKVVPQRDAGRRVFEQVLIPLNTNATVVAPISFSYFDPLAGAYRTRNAGPFPLSFHARAVTQAEPGYSPVEAAGDGTTAPPEEPAGVRPLRTAEGADRAASESAAESYRNGYFGAAVEEFKKLVESEPGSGPRLYNLGTSLLAARQYGPAVLYLRRAQRAGLRGRDLHRNLDMAIRLAGAPRMPGPAAVRLLQDGPPRRWEVWAAVTGILGLGVLVAASLRRPWRHGLRVAGILLWIAAAALVAASRSMERRAKTEAVIVRGAPVRLAASDRALQTLHFAEGTIVGVAEEAHGWLKVTAPRGSGWVPRERVERVIPPTAESLASHEP